VAQAVLSLCDFEEPSIEAACGVGFEDEDEKDTSEGSVVERALTSTKAVSGGTEVGVTEETRPGR
jgi:hypothetical protein